jgi:hypothetical protein
MAEQLTTYEQFVAALNKRPADQSPLMWLARLYPRPPQATQWMMRWLRGSRA